jgi:hypothetical protein
MRLFMQRLLGENKATRRPTAAGSKCCTNYNFSFSGLHTCDDIVKKCDPICKVCSAVKTPAGKRYQCTDTFLGICGPPCKN